MAQLPVLLSGELIEGGTLESKGIVQHCCDGPAKITSMTCREVGGSGDILELEWTALC